MKFGENKHLPRDDDSEGVSKPKAPGFNPFQEYQRYFTKDHPPVFDGLDERNTFMLARIFSMHGASFYAADILNSLGSKLPRWIGPLILWYNIPSTHRPPFIKYVKSASEKQTEKYKATIKCICEHYKVRQFHAEQIYDVLTAQKISVETAFGQLIKGEK